MKWQDLSLALKLGVAFGFVLCMTVILGGGSFLGIRKIVTNAGEVIKGNVIRADIASAEIAHLNWTKKVSSFLTANTGEELDVQVDDHLCAFGKWLYGEGRKEAELMVPSLAPHLKKIEQIHHELHLSAAHIKESYHRSDPGLPAVLAEKEIDHLRFVNRVKDVFNGTAADFAVETNPRQCGLGKWLYGEGAREAIEREPELKSAIEALMEPHARLHESISDLKTLWNAGEQDRGRSREIFTTVTMPAFHQIEKGLSTIRKMAVQDLAGMERANEIYVTTTLPALNRVQEILGLVKKEVDGNMMTDTVMLDSANRTRTMLIVTAILTVFLGGFISFLTARKIAAPLIKGVNFADRIAAGDLSDRLDVEQNDEVGRLARALNGMSGNLKTIIGSIIEKSTQVSTSSDGLLEASAQMSSRAQELSEQAAATRTATEGVTGNIDQVAETGETMNAKARDIAETAAVMSENVNNVAAAIEQMSSSIQEVARNCSKAQEFAGNAKDKGDDSMVLIRELDQAARDIGNVINVITEITEQTKLLALNATIEAARAGDAGKGFAVVANEVKDLAKQTAEATENIISQIQNMQARTGSVVEVIGEISGINEQVNEINTTIAAAVEEQTATVGEIARTIAGTAQGVEGVTGNIRELSVDIREKVITSISNAVSGAEDISTNINGISEICSSAAQSAVVVKDAAGELAGMAAGLKEQVSRFKLS